MAHILIFDSGVGGLSVFQEIQKQLPSINYTYLFDNEAYPYGELEPDVLITRMTDLIGQVVKVNQFDLVVIACNTASTIVLPHLRQTLSIPVVGVVPAIKPAAALSQRAIGLIATPATVSRQYTHDLINEFSPIIPVELLGSTRLVTMAEEKLRGGEVDIEELRQVLIPLIGKIDVAVLGCTHFPLLKDEIKRVLGEEVKLVDSGCAIANRVAGLLANKSEETVEAGQYLPYAIYSSATPWDSVALDRGLKHFGFRPTQLLSLDV